MTEKIEKERNLLVELIVSGKELSTKNLNSIGFNSNHLTKLINLNILERVKRGEYRVVNFKILYDRGKSLAENGEYDKATLYLEKCLEIAPNSVKVHLKLIRLNVHLGNINEALKYLKQLYKINIMSKNDCNFLLYLLLKLISLMENDKKIMLNLNKDDIISSLDNKKMQKLKNILLKSNYSISFELVHDALKGRGTKEYKKTVNCLIFYINQQIKNKYEVKSYDSEVLNDVLSVINCNPKEDEIPEKNVNGKEIFELLDSGLSLEEVCSKLDLSENQKCLIYLNFAKQYYFIGDDFMGDYYFTKVSKAKNKSQVVMREYEMLRGSRKFLKYRELTYENSDNIVIERLFRERIK